MGWLSNTRTGHSWNTYFFSRYICDRFSRLTSNLCRIRVPWWLWQVFASMCETADRVSLLLPLCWAVSIPFLQGLYTPVEPQDRNTILKWSPTSAYHPPTYRKSITQTSQIRPHIYSPVTSFFCLSIYVSYQATQVHLRSACMLVCVVVCVWVCVCVCVWQSQHIHNTKTSSSHVYSFISRASLVSSCLCNKVHLRPSALRSSETAFWHVPVLFTMNNLNKFPHHSQSCLWPQCTVLFTYSGLIVLSYCTHKRLPWVWPPGA